MDHSEKLAIIEGMLYNIIRPLVDKPEAVKISKMVNSAQNTIVFGLSVDKSDLGKVIGKNGRNANSIRILVNAVAMKAGVRVLLDIDNFEQRRSNA